MSTPPIEISPSDGNAQKSSLFRATLAFAGVALGILMVAGSLAQQEPGGEEDGSAVAWVNGRAIPVSRFRMMLEGVNAERLAVGAPPFSPIDLADRLVEEELLVDQAVRLGLPYSDNITRGYLINRLTSMISEEAFVAEPSQERLERFYRENLPRFVVAESFAADFIYLSGNEPNAHQQMETLAGIWTSMPPGSKPPQTGWPPMELPRGMVPVAKWSDYLGAEIAGRLAQIEAGSLSAPFEWMDGWLVGRIIQRKGGSAPPFEEAQRLALDAWRREEAARAYREYIERLRDEAQVTLSDSLKEEDEK